MWRATIACDIVPGPISLIEGAKDAAKGSHGLYMRMPVRLRQVIAEFTFAAAAAVCIIAVILPSAIEGLPLRRSALLGEVAILFLNWIVWRRMPERASRIMRGGLFAAGVGVGLLLMTFHLAGGINTLAGFVSLLAMYAARHSYDDPEVAAEEALRDAQKPALRSAASYAFENIENIAVSLVVVVLIWHFCLEAFRIPSGSMLPTLYGDPVWGDRVLVDKVVYQFRDPIRWEPTVFRYPLRRTDPYVKRVIGLPGEQLLIAQGDVFARKTAQGEIELLDKSPSARHPLWYPVAGEIKDKSDFLKCFAREGDVDIDAGVIRLSKDSIATFPKGSDGGPGDVRDHDPDGNGGNSEIGYNLRMVGDLRVKVKVESLKSDLEVTIARDADAYTLTLSSDKARCALRHSRAGTDPQENEVGRLQWGKLAASEGDVFTFSLADGVLQVMREDSTLITATVGSGLLDALRNFDKSRKAQGKPVEPLNSEAISRVAQGEIEASHRARITFAGADAKVRVLGVDRDIYYVGRMLDIDEGGKTALKEMPYGFALGDDEYFCMGDNSPNSKDCRFWIALEIVLNDGTLYTGGLDDEGQVIAAFLNSEPSGEPLNYKAPDGRTVKASCLRSLQRIARFSQKERGPNLPSNADILKASVEGLKRAAGEKQLTRVQFITEGGGVVYVNLADIKEFRVRNVAYVKRDLFVGKPFAVFLWPHRMKLIE
jgi:signal peptidase I